MRCEDGERKWQQLQYYLCYKHWDERRDGPKVWKCWCRGVHFSAVNGKIWCI
uniref:Uncharacterized protein n=1 Tax=Parascaris equorum TaxID=6256 RepID=A0A914RPH6_PAREQ